MGGTRFILLVALGLVLTMIWQEWQQDYPQQEPRLQDGNVVQNNNTDIIDIPSVPAEHQSVMTIDAGKSSPSAINKQVVHVKTDVFDIKINTLGATIQSLALLNYPISKNKLDEPVVLLYDREREFYLYQSGLLSKVEAVDHRLVYRFDEQKYHLGEADELKVPFFYDSKSGLKIKKTFTFYKNSYLVDVDYQVTNNSPETWTGQAYQQLNRTEPNHSISSRLIYTYTGAVISSPENRYEKISFGDIKQENLAVDITNGWIAMLQHYFLAALIPASKEEPYHYYTLNPKSNSRIVGSVAPAQSIASSSNGVFNTRVYLGPKLQKDLQQIAEGLDLTVDYGIFWFIAKPLYWLLDYIYRFTHNWGWSIVLVTLLLKLLFFNLSAAGYRSMAKMRKVQPRLVALKERYKKDRAGLNKAMMDIYKQEKINPLGGCLPVLVQIPVFISLYWVLLESVELRQASFALWVQDLSTPDPYFILPILMGITMFIQQKLNPTPLDPIQEKVLTFLPVIFTVFFAFFPAGLVLYWVVNNILSIAQQWIITRNISATS